MRRSCGAFHRYPPQFWSPVTPAAFSVDFYPPVSGAENSVPGDGGSRRPTPFASPGMVESWAPKAPSQTESALLRIKSEAFELPAPFSGSIAQSFDSNATWQTTFDCCPHQTRCQERKRDRHIDLTHTAFLTRCDLLNVGHRARYDLVEPATTSGNCADQARTALDPSWADVIFQNAVRNKNLSGSSGWRFLPRD